MRYDKYTPGEKLLYEHPPVGQNTGRKYSNKQLVPRKRVLSTKKRKLTKLKNDYDTSAKNQKSK